MTRDEAKFNDIEQLSAQIARDCEEAKAYHGSVKDTATPAQRPEKSFRVFCYKTA